MSITPCDVHYHRSVFVYAECDSRPEIVLSGNDIAFSAQDFAILTVSCVDIRSKGKGSNAFAARQFAIMDVQDVRIGRIEDGSALVAGEMSKINCLSGLVLYGDVGYVAQASGMSTVHLNCAFTFENTPRLHAIVLAVQRSFILAPGAKGVGSVIGKKYICEDSRIDGAANFPGSDSSSVNDCFVR